MYPLFVTKVLGIPTEDKNATLYRLMKSEAESDIDEHGRHEHDEIPNFEVPEIRRSESPQNMDGTFTRNLTNRKSMGHVPLIDGTMQPGYGLAEPRKGGICTVIYRYFFFLLNLIFVIAGIISIGFGIYGIIRVKVDGLNDPILLCSDPAFLALILGKLTLYIQSS